MGGNSTDREQAGHASTGQLTAADLEAAVDGYSHDIDEDPVRFLDTEIPKVQTGEQTRGILAGARIDGIESVAVATAWVAAENALAEVRGRDSRDHVCNRIRSRIVELNEHGEYDADYCARVARSVRENHPEWWARATAVGEWPDGLADACSWLAGDAMEAEPEPVKTSRSLAPTSNTTSAPDASEASSLDQWATAGGDEE